VMSYPHALQAPIGVVTGNADSYAIVDLGL
jgi:hypothetical protein